MKKILIVMYVAISIPCCNVNADWIDEWLSAVGKTFDDFQDPPNGSTSDFEFVDPKKVMHVTSGFIGTITPALIRENRFVIAPGAIQINWEAYKRNKKYYYKNTMMKIVRDHLGCQVSEKRNYQNNYKDELYTKNYNDPEAKLSEFKIYFGPNGPYISQRDLDEARRKNKPLPIMSKSYQNQEKDEELGFPIASSSSDVIKITKPTNLLRYKKLSPLNKRIYPKYQPTRWERLKKKCTPGEKCEEGCEECCLPICAGCGMLCACGACGGICFGLYLLLVLFFPSLPSPL